MLTSFAQYQRSIQIETLYNAGIKQGMDSVKRINISKPKVYRVLYPIKEKII